MKPILPGQTILINLDGIPQTPASVLEAHATYDGPWYLVKVAPENDYDTGHRTIGEWQIEETAL